MPFILCSGGTVYRGAMDGKERVCSGGTVYRGAMTSHGCDLLENAGAHCPDGKERVCSGGTVCHVHIDVTKRMAKN